MWYCLAPFLAFYSLVGIFTARSAYKHLPMHRAFRFVLAGLDGIFWPVVIWMGWLDRYDELKSHQTLRNTNSKRK